MNNSVLDYIYGRNKVLASTDSMLDNSLASEMVGTNDVLDSIYGPAQHRGRPAVPRDEYGNTEKAIASEKTRIAQTMALADTTQTPVDLGNGATAIPDEGKPEEGKPGGTYVGEISDEYASKHRAERLQKQNILQEQALGEISRTQYKNERNDRLRNKPTSMLERLANDVDDGYDDVMDYIFGKTKYKNKAEEEAAARADMNLEFDEDGNAMYSRQTTMNDKSLDSLTGELMQLEDDPDADQMIYYGRIDNPDGTHSYKIGLAGVDPYGRTKDEDRGKDITYLWAKRTNEAAKYESLFHGNRTLLKDRRNDIGTDVEGYGAGKSEIYNNDFLRLDGGVSLDKIKTLNRSSQSKLAELGVNVTGRYDSRGMESGYAALDKAKRIYGANSKEAKELEYLMGNMEQKGEKTRALIDVPMDLASAVGSSAQQMVAGIGDAALDASANLIDAGQGKWLDNTKSMEQADKTWGYKGRQETEVLGRQAVREFKKGNYVGALWKGIQAAPDTVAQSLPDMVLMAAGGAGLAAKGASFSTKLAAYMNPVSNKGLAAFAAKQTNNQIDERLEAGEDNTNIAKIGAMFASNYVLGGIDRIAFRQQIKPAFSEPIKKMMKSIPEEGMVAVAAKAAGVVAKLVKAGAIEAGQEYIQTYGETINAGLGTDKYGNDAFSDHFLDEATKGALLGFGAGGLMHGGAMSVTASKEQLKETKRKNEFTEDNMPFNDTGTPLDGLNPNMTTEEILEAVGDDPKKAYDTVNEYFTELEPEERDALLANELQNSTLMNFLNAVDTKPEATATKGSFNKHDTSGLLERVVDAKTMNDTQAKEDLEQELFKPNGSTVILKAVDDIANDSEISKEQKDKLANVFMSIATNPTGEDNIIARHAEAALSKLGIDFKLEKGSDKSAEDSYGSLFGTKVDVNSQNREQKFRSIVEAIVGRKAGKGVDSKARVKEVVDFFMNLNPNAQKNKQRQDLLDFMTVEGYGSAIKEVSEAMEVLSDDNKQDLLEIETKINHLLLEIGATNSTRGPEQRKTIFTTRYDMLIGNKDADYFSIQNYIDNAMRLMQPHVPITVRNTGLRNLATRLDSWIEVQDKKISSDDIRLDKLKDRAIEELGMFENTRALLDGFLDNNKTKTENTETTTEELVVTEDEETINYKPKHSFQTMPIPVNAVIVPDGDNYMDGATEVEVHNVSKSKKVNKYYAEVTVTFDDGPLKFDVQITEKAATDFAKHKFKTEKQLKKEKTEHKKQKQKKQKKKDAKKTTAELLKETIKKLVVNDSYNDVIDKAEDGDALLEVVKAIVKADAFMANTNTYALIKTLETGVDFISFGYKHMDTVKPEIDTQPISDKSVKNKDELDALELDKIFITPDEEFNLNAEVTNDAALQKLNKIVAAVVNIFTDKPLSQDELKQNKALVLLLDENGKLDSSYLNLSISATVESIVKTSRSLTVDYNDVNKEERLNMDTEGVDANELAAAGIPKSTLVNIIVEQILEGIDWKKAKKKVTLDISDVSTEKNKVITVDENAHNLSTALTVLAAKIVSQMTADSLLTEHNINNTRFVRFPVTYMWESSIPVTDIDEVAAFETIGDHLDLLNEKLGFTENEEKVGIITDPKHFGSIARFVKRSKQVVSEKAKETIQNIRNTAFRIANKNSAILKARPEKLFEMYGVELATIPPAVLSHFWY